MDENIVKIDVTFEPIKHFDVLLDLISHNHMYPLYFMKKDNHPDTLAVVDNYNYYDKETHTPTWRLYDRPGSEGQVGQNHLSMTLICFKLLCK